MAMSMNVYRRPTRIFSLIFLCLQINFINTGKFHVYHCRFNVYQSILKLRNAMSFYNIDLELFTICRFQIATYKTKLRIRRVILNCAKKVKRFAIML